MMKSKAVRRSGVVARQGERKANPKSPSVGADRKPIPKRDLATKLEARLGARVRALMDERQISVNDMTDRLADQGIVVTGVTVHRWLKGTAKPDIDAVKALGKVLCDDWRMILPEE